MAKAKQSQEKVKKASVRKQVAEKLTNDFGDIKKALGDKQFSKRVKKASKILSEGIEKKAAEPKAAKVKKAIKPQPAKSKKKVAKKAVNKKTVS